MALNYPSYITQLTTLMVTQPDNPAFVAILPGIIDYAEQRIYRELDLVATSNVDASAAFSPLIRSLALPVFVVLEEINVITPAGVSPDSGTRHPLTPVDQSYLDAVWNSSANAGVPQHFCLLTQNISTNAPTILVGPWPDQGYTVEVTGTQRPTPLSAGQLTTFLTLFLPDLFIAASMIFASGYMRNFGSQADDPKMAASWEAQYTALLASANAEELRKSFAGPGWTSASEVAQPQNR